MRRGLLLAFALVFLTALGRADVKYPALPNRAWDVGEHLTYAVKYGPIRAGTSILEVEDEIVWQGRPALRIKSSTTSADWFFYRVRDTIISTFDKQGLFTWQYEKHQREGNYRNDEVAKFSPAEKKVYRNDDGRKSPPEPVEAFVKDILGALYYTRAQKIKFGETKSIKIPVHDGRRSYQMEIDILRRERVRVPAGEFDCLVIEPKLQSDGIFVRKGRLFLWLTDDDRHIPVRIRTVIPIGSIVANLEKMSGVKAAK